MRALRGASGVQTEARLHEEQTRGALCLDPSSTAKLVRIVEKEMIEQHATALLEVCGRGCSARARACSDAVGGRRRRGSPARCRSRWTAPAS